MLETINLSEFDQLLLILSPVMGFFGATTRALILEGDLKTYSKEGKKFLESFTYKDFQWMTYHAFIGAITGLLIALLFIGGLKEEISSFGRVLAIALIAGYSSPGLWMRQEKIIDDIIEKKLKEINKN